MARVLGVDPGSKRCGIAITDSKPSMAFPRPAIARDDKTLTRLRELVEEESVSTVVIGRPVSLAETRPRVPKTPMSSSHKSATTSMCR